MTKGYIYYQPLDRPKFIVNFHKQPLSIHPGELQNVYIVTNEIF